MPSHLFITGAPVSAIRSSELGSTGMRGIIALPVRDQHQSPWRAGLRGLFAPVATRHRATFIPLSTFAFQAD
jgi:hypothetical protein